MDPTELPTGPGWAPQPAARPMGHMSNRPGSPATHMPQRVVSLNGNVSPVSLHHWPHWPHWWPHWGPDHPISTASHSRSLPFDHPCNACTMGHAAMHTCATTPPPPTDPVVLETAEGSAADPHPPRTIHPSTI
ncbi:unnamed protein product [Cutaneotrichosporon oleaginosum]